MAAGRVPVTTAAWAALPDAARFGADGLQALALRLQSALGGLGGAAGLANQTVSTGLPGLLPGLLSGLGTALLVARYKLAIGAVILLVIAGATLALATVMLSSQRQGEAALLRSRGASRWQVAGSGLAETGLLILPAVLAGPLLGGLLLPPLASHGRRLRGRDRPAVAAPGGLAGADERVALPPQAPLPVGQVASLSRAAGVTGATPVIRSPVVGSGSGTATLLALDARQARSVAAIRPDLAGGSPALLLDRLAPPRPAPGAPVPGPPGPAADHGQPQRPLGDPGGACRPGDGRLRGLLSADRPGRCPPTAGRTRSHRGHRAAQRRSLPAAGHRLRAGSTSCRRRPAPDAVLRIASVRAAAAMNGGFGAPFPAASASGRMAFSASNGGGAGQRAAAGGQRGSPAGRACRWSFAPGSGIYPAQFGSLAIRYRRR